jgi:hypothetical protein
MKRALLCLLAFPVLAGPLYVERMTELETRDTIPAEGEVVAVVDDGAQTVQLRYGDAATVGGLIIADPYSLKSAYYRPLTRGEYSLTLGGNATFSNNVYHIITSHPAGDYQAGNVGTLRILPRAAGTLISSVSYGLHDYSATLTKTVLPGYATGATNVLFSGAMLNAGSIVGGEAHLILSNLVVNGWVGTHLIGATNDCRGTLLMVRDAVGDDEALNLGEHNRLMADHRGDDWSLYAATNRVQVAYQDLMLSPTARMRANDGGVDVAITTPFGTLVTNAVEINYDPQACTIVGYSLSDALATLFVESSVMMTNPPAIQWTTNALASNVWKTATTVTDWPTNSFYTAGDGTRFKTWTLSADRHVGAAYEYYRVTGYPATATNSVTLNLPLIPVAGITMEGVNVKTWAELKAHLATLP